MVTALVLALPRLQTSAEAFARVSENDSDSALRASRLFDCMLLNAEPKLKLLTRPSAPCTLVPFVEEVWYPGADATAGDAHATSGETDFSSMTSRPCILETMPEAETAVPYTSIRAAAGTAAASIPPTAR